MVKSVFPITSQSPPEAFQTGKEFCIGLIVKLWTLANSWERRVRAAPVSIIMIPEVRRPTALGSLMATWRFGHQAVIIGPCTLVGWAIFFAKS